MDAAVSMSGSITKEIEIGVTETCFKYLKKKHESFPRTVKAIYLESGFAYNIIVSQSLDLENSQPNEPNISCPKVGVQGG